LVLQFSKILANGEFKEEDQSLDAVKTAQIIKGK